METHWIIDTWPNSFQSCGKNEKRAAIYTALSPVRKGKLRNEYFLSSTSFMFRPKLDFTRAI